MLVSSQILRAGSSRIRALIRIFSVAQLADGGRSNVQKAMLPFHFFTDAGGLRRNSLGEGRVFAAASRELGGVLKVGQHVWRDACALRFGGAHASIVLRSENAINP